MFPFRVFPVRPFPSRVFPRRDLALGYSYVAFSASRRNAAIWTYGDYVDTLGKRCAVDLKLLAGTRRNGGIILNYHLLGTPPRPDYYIAELDHNNDALQIRRFNGFSFTSPLGTVSPLGLQLGQWYNLSVTTAAGPGASQVTIAATVAGINNPSLTATVSVAVNGYLPADGTFGVGTDRAIARFSWFQLEEV